MSISHSTARWVAPLAFAIDFAAQLYGILSSPNMKDIHDANLSFFSPQPYLVAAFFFPQQLLQLAWLYRLWRINPAESAVKKREAQVMVDYVPYSVLGNLCLAIWMIFWNNSALKVANVFVFINTLAQLSFISIRQPALHTHSPSSVLTHLVSKTLAGLGVLDLLHNSSVAYFKDQSASITVKVLTGAGFGALALCSDWIFGGCLVYDLVAMAVGQRGIGARGWSGLLGGYAVGVGAVVGVKNWFRPPYVKDSLDVHDAAETEGLV